MKKNMVVKKVAVKRVDQVKKSQDTKCVGVHKEIDHVGRIVVPKELRDLFSLYGTVEMVATEEGVLLRNPAYRLIKIEK